MDFSQFKTPEVKRSTGGLTPRTQNYDNMKYRKVEVTTGEGDKKVTTYTGKFEISDKLFKDLNLSQLALRPFFDDNNKSTILIAVVNEKDGRFLRQRVKKDTKETLSKSAEFKQDFLEKALAEAGIIVTEGEGVVGMNQYIDFVSVAKNITIQGVNCIEVFKLAKGTIRPSAKASTTVAQPTDTPVAAPTPVSTPVTEPVAAPKVDKEDWS